MSDTQRVTVPDDDGASGEQNPGYENPPVEAGQQAGEEPQAAGQQAQGGEEAPGTLSIPDKFKNQDGTLNQQALLKSYGAMETAQSDKDKAQEPADQDAQQAAKADTTPGGDLKSDLDKWSGEIAENGELSKETIATISKKHNITPEYLGEILEGQKAIAQINAREIQDAAGGPDAFNKMLQWASNALGKEQAETFIGELDAAKRNGHDAKLKVLLDGMMAQHKAATGQAWAPELTGTDPSGEAIKPFSNIREMLQIQGSREYKEGDENYHRVFDMRLAATKKAGIF